MSQLYTPQVDELLEQHFTVLCCIYFFYKGPRSQLTMPDALKLLSDCELWNQEARCPTSPLCPACHRAESPLRLGFCLSACVLDGILLPRAKRRSESWEPIVTLPSLTRRAISDCFVEQIGLQMRDAKMAFVHSRMLRLDDLKVQREGAGRDTLCAATFVEFLEFIARVADQISVPTAEQLQELGTTVRLPSRPVPSRPFRVC